jgi:hypothetical protein
MLSTMLEKNWPTANARDWKDSGPTQGNRQNPNLGTAVVKDAANWPTPNAQVSQDGESPETWLKRKEAMKAKGYNGNGCGTPLTIAVQLHGQAAPASSNTSGSRQGLWPTASVPNGGQTTSGRADKDTKKQVRLEHAVAQWATPRSGKTTDENPETWALRQAKGDVATMPLTAQVKQWATPRNCGGPDYAKTTRPSSQSNSLSLPTQVAGKLNPRWVETLMGLPIGWTMPSCTSPQTIAPMSCGSLAMELCRPPQSELSEFLLAS